MHVQVCSGSPCFSHFNVGFSCVRLSGLKSCMAKARFAFPGDVKAAWPQHSGLNNSNGFERTFA